MKKAVKITLIILALAAVTALCVWLIPIILSLREPKNQVKFESFINSLGIWGVLLMFVTEVLQIIVAVIPGEPIELLQIDETVERAQREKLAALKKRRSPQRVGAALDRLRRVAASEANTMPALLEAVRAYATVGEICGTLGDVFGSYQEKSIL
jgi:hypothetical protein